MLYNVETPWLTARPPMLCTRHALAVVLITCTPVDASGPASHGAELLRTRDCMNCHALDAPGARPPLRNFWGSIAMASDGRMVRVDGEPGVALIKQSVFAPKAFPLHGNPLTTYPQLDVYEGVHMRYYWSDWETTPKDYTAGLAQLDKDIAAVKQQGKKLLVFLNYQKSDGTHCVPPDLLIKPGPWCSGDFCGELPNNGAALPIYWNDAVAQRMRAWLEAMAGHLEDHPDRDLIAGITLPETATGDYDLPALEATGYTTDKYLSSVQGTLSGLVDAAPSLIVFQYINGGFKPSPGESGPGPNAFTLDQFSAAIPANPTNPTPPTW